VKKVRSWVVGTVIARVQPNITQQEKEEDTQTYNGRLLTAGRGKKSAQSV